MDVKHMGYQLIQNRDERWDFVNTVMNLQFINWTATWQRFCKLLCMPKRRGPYCERGTDIARCL